MATAVSRFGLTSSKPRPDDLSAADIIKMKRPAKGFLCPNYVSNPVQFIEFQIKDMKSNKIFFDIGRPVESLDWTETAEIDADDSSRSIQYEFPKEILTYDSIGTNLVFAVGPKPLGSFRMIEIHYFKDKMIKSFDFSFGFCIPNSVNTWENVYKVPKLDEKTIKDMVASPYKTVSDSYYFVDDKLVMHNKAYYSYY
ncbi:GMP-PDE, delta subunit-domain-containing protein [Obelidium mucronatum]|nr:GMP-PDE, delta subunit-domain-containing protein [Obelidium mucronatum]